MRLAAEEFALKYCGDLLHGDGLKVGDVQNLRGILNARIDLANGYTQALLPSDQRSPEFFEVFKTGFDGALGDNNEAVIDCLIDLQTELPFKYDGEAAWYMSRNTFKSLRKIKINETAGDIRPLLTSDFGTAGVDQGFALFGKPVYLVDQMPSMDGSTASTPIIYGDLGMATEWLSVSDSEHFIIDEITAKGVKKLYQDSRKGEVINENDSIVIALAAV